MDFQLIPKSLTCNNLGMTLNGVLIADARYHCDSWAVVGYWTSLAIPPWVGEIRTSDSRDYCWRRNCECPGPGLLQWHTDLVS